MKTTYLSFALALLAVSTGAPSWADPAVPASGFPALDPKNVKPGMLADVKKKEGQSKNTAPEQKKFDMSSLDQLSKQSVQNPKAPATTATGRYQMAVVPGSGDDPNSAVPAQLYLLDTTTGQTWRMGAFVWEAIPLPR
jgi:hypothetical protein